MSKVQILIPAYNSELTLGKTLDSLLAQTYTNFEILVVDNASTDKTRELVESYKDPRVFYTCNEVNLGNYGNFDKCISLARYDYTAIFHADDVYMPTIIAEQVEILDRDSKVGAVFTEATKVNNQLEKIGNIKTPFLVRSKSHNNIINFDFDFLLKSIIHNNCFLMAPSAMVRSKIYTSEIVSTRTQYFGNAADVDVWLRIAQKWNVTVITKSLMNYRISKSQHTYRINQNRTERGEYAHIVQYYRGTHNDLLKTSQVAIKREKIIDMIIRFDSFDRKSRRSKQYSRIIFNSFLDLRLYRSPRWWKYFTKFLINYFF